VAEMEKKKVIGANQGVRPVVTVKRNDTARLLCTNRATLEREAPANFAVSVVSAIFRCDVIIYKLMT
jgi:hypothetical protein